MSTTNRVVYVESVPEMEWLNTLGRKIVALFNECKSVKDQPEEDKKNLLLGLEPFPDEVKTGTDEEIKSLIEDGRFNYIYPKNNVASLALKDVVEDSESANQYFYFGNSELLNLD